MTENNADNALEVVDTVEESRDEDFTTESEAEAMAEAITDDGDDSEYYTVRIESGNLLWSALAVIFAILSVVLFAFFYIGGIISAAAAIVFSIMSSRKLLSRKVHVLDRLGNQAREHLCQDQSQNAKHHADPHQLIVKRFDHR